MRNRKAFKEEVNDWQKRIKNEANPKLKELYQRNLNEFIKNKGFKETDYSGFEETVTDI